jgi:hypothetical protein
MDTMSRRDKGTAAAMQDKSTETEPTPDEETEEQPQAPGAEPDEDETDDFEVDASLIPSDVELEELAPDFIRPEGFLMVPRLNPKTGEISPRNTTFAGILNDIVPWIDNRGKPRVWYSCTATADIPGSMYTGKDEKTNREFRRPIKKGERIGISGSGAINALKTKKGHFIYLHWTGNKVAVKNGNMWEIKAKVSKEPVKAPF